MLQVNQNAPVFSVQNQDRETISLSDFVGRKNVILYFYPKDDTPGCTIEANQFTQLAEQFAQQDTVVLGVSKDSCESHTNFIDKYDLKVALLADVDGQLCEDYGVWQEKEKEGVKKMGIVRSTFLIDKSGKLQHAEYGVDPDGHARAMLERVEQLQTLYLEHT
jgi:peroxiredoxin